MHIRKYIISLLKKISNGFRVATHKLVSGIVEAARTISYVETVSNKADTLHRHVKSNSETDIKKAFEFNTRKALRRIGLGRVTLAIDITHELYYGKNGKLNVRQKKHEKGTGESFAYVVLSVVNPRSLPLMAVPYRQGDDLSSLVKELLIYAKSLPININLVLFDRGFYIWDLISFLSSEKIRYLIFVPQNEAMKDYISQTEHIASFIHEREYNKNKTNFIGRTKIVVIRDLIKNSKDYYWCFATNLKESLYLISKYKQRWQIETDFRVHDEARIKTKSNYSIIRYFYFMTSLLLMANWEVDRLKHPNRCFKKYLKFVQEQFENGIG